jgi:hypothetical protein
MTPSAVKSIGKKKRRREKKEGVSTCSAALGAYEPKQRKRRVQRGGPPAPGTYTFLSCI